MDNSPLNRLSNEILNRIAELALSHDGERVDVRYPMGWYPSDKPVKLRDFEIITERTMRPNVGALLHTCKWMRREYTRMFFASNHFTVIVERDLVTHSTLAFLYAIGPNNASLIQSLIINTNFGRCHYPGGFQDHTTVDMIPSLNSTIQDLRTNVGNLTGMLRVCRDVKLLICFTVAGGTTIVHFMTFDDCQDMYHSIVDNLFEMHARIRGRTGLVRVCDLPLFDLLYKELRRLMRKYRPPRHLGGDHQ